MAHLGHSRQIRSEGSIRFAGRTGKGNPCFETRFEGEEQPIGISLLFSVRSCGFAESAGRFGSVKTQSVSACFPSAVMLGTCKCILAALFVNANRVTPQGAVKVSE